MLTYSFENIGNDSLYEFLYKSIKNDILNGSLSSNEKLPSKRSFAKNLGISTITIENAYAQLLAEGYIYSIPKKGYYVSDYSFPVLQTKKSNFQIIPPNNNEQKKIFADFSSNQTQSENFPFSIWAKLLRELLTSEQPELMKNSPCNGVFELRAAIANHLRQYRDMDVSPEQIIIGAGTEYLYGLLIELLGYDKKYCLEDPGYRKISQIYNSHHVKTCFVPLSDNAISVDILEKQNAQILHTSPSHHFPTGKIMPIGQRYELLNWASKSKERYIIEDDYDSEFRFDGKPLPTLQSIDALDKVIYMNTFTKTLASTIRISYMVLPLHLVSVYKEKLAFYSCTVSTFEQYTLARFMERGFFEKHLNRMRNYYQKKRTLLLNCIHNSPLEHYVTISEDNSGLHFLMHIEMNKDDKTFIEELDKKGIRLFALAGYFQKPQQNVCHIFVLNYSAISDECIPEAIQAIYECLQQ